MKEDVFPKIILQWCPKEKRRSGRPKITWTNYITNSYKAYELDDAVALDREKCKRNLKNIFICQGILPFSGNS